VRHVGSQGWVFLADRAANLIISGGVNVHPAEVEAGLQEHPAVADAAVFGTRPAPAPFSFRTRRALE
jgi:acyl-CoA synthetase (AMP-forming)/AMP-acid ligase II